MIKKTFRLRTAKMPKKHEPSWEKYIYVEEDEVKREITETGSTIKYNVTLPFPPGQLMEATEMIVDPSELSSGKKRRSLNVTRGNCDPNILKQLLINDPSIPLSSDDLVELDKVGIYYEDALPNARDKPKEKKRMELKFKSSGEDGKENLYTIGIHLEEKNEQTVPGYIDDLARCIHDFLLDLWPNQREKMESLTLKNCRKNGYIDRDVSNTLSQNRSRNSFTGGAERRRRQVKKSESREPRSESDPSANRSSSFRI
jgi:hypothetical protein